MNEKFYTLPEEKQWRIIRAGWKIFSGRSYRKSPVGEIAKEAGISKSLLFHYFKNKKELYFFLLEAAISEGERVMEMDRILQEKDFFRIMEMGMELKLWMMQEHPELSQFVITAFYEKDEEIATMVQAWTQRILEKYSMPMLEKADTSKFREDIDLQMMYQEMFWATDGCVRAMLQAGPIDLEKARIVFHNLMEFWKSVYLKKE